MAAESTYEVIHLKDQIEELSAQIDATDAQIDATAAAAASRQRLVAELSSSIDARTRERITPQLQAFADATANLAQAEGLSRELEKTHSNRSVR